MYRTLLVTLIIYYYSIYVMTTFFLTLPVNTLYASKGHVSKTTWLKHILYRTLLLFFTFFGNENSHFLSECFLSALIVGGINATIYVVVDSCSIQLTIKKIYFSFLAFFTETSAYGIARPRVLNLLSVYIWFLYHQLICSGRK